LEDYKKMPALLAKYLNADDLIFELNLQIEQPQ
jgi:hypothetical protein